jgi:MraZ protein
MEPDGRFSLPAEFAGVLEIGNGVMLVGKGDKFQLWNPGRWQTRRDSDRDKMAAFVRGLGTGDA